MVDFIGLGILLLGTVLFGYLAVRAWGSKNAILKWVGLVLAGLLTLVFGVVLITAVLGTISINQNYNASNPAPNITIERTPEQLARGEQLAKTCAGCHGVDGDFPLTGNDFAGEGPPFGTLWSANLTPAGETATWTDGELVRALREGIHQSGRSLFVMPSPTYHNYSDQDAQAIVAYLRSQPAAGAPNPPTQLNVIAALILQAVAPNMKSAQPPISQPVPMPAASVNMEYGQYMATVSGCGDCHGMDFGGGVDAGNFGPPAGPTIRDLGKRYTEEQFVNMFRTGMTASGRPLTDAMPWKDYVLYPDVDLQAMYMYLSSLPPQ